MNIPGVNLLSIAGRAIRFQRVTWLRFMGRVENELGVWVPAYYPPTVIKGSWQPVSRDRYEQQGLDLTRKYYNFFTSHPLRGVDVDRGADLVEYRGRRHEVVDVLPWDEEDGWSNVLVVEVSPIYPLPENGDE